MAEFVTKKENQRRLITVIVCIAFDTLALLGGIYAFKNAGDIEKGTKSDTIVKLKESIAQTRSQNETLESTAVQFSSPVGWRNASHGTADRLGSSRVKGEELKRFLDYWVNDQFPKYEIKGFIPPTQKGEGEALTLTKLFEKLAEKEADLRNKIATAATDKTALEGRDAVTKTETENIEKADLADINRLRDEYTRLLRDLSNKEKTHAVELDGDGTANNRGLAGEAYERQTTLTDHLNNVVRVKAQLSQVKKELDMRINWLTHREAEAEERKEPDGEILAVYSAESIGYIDLIHKDRIFRGGRFSVYALEKGGVKIDKGWVEILEVGKENYSRIAIYSKDSSEPIKKGDKIYNKYYERGKTRNIAIAGRLMGKVSNEEAVKLIKDFGDNYQDKVDEKTNYVIVGDGYEESANFKLAEDWGVKILLERSFYDYLGIP